jgi:hypothetical protein
VIGAPLSDAVARMSMSQPVRRCGRVDASLLGCRLDDVIDRSLGWGIARIANRLEDRRRRWCITAAGKQRLGDRRRCVALPTAADQISEHGGRSGMGTDGVCHKPTNAVQQDACTDPFELTRSPRRPWRGAMARPSAFAVLRLTTISNFIGCRTGRSAGFSPLRTRPV